MISDPAHHGRLERMHASAPINRFFQPTIRVGNGVAEVVMTVRADFHHAAHALHGSLYFKCLDDAEFFAARSVVTDVFVLTVTFNVVLLRPVSEGIITASGRRHLHARRDAARRQRRLPLARRPAVAAIFPGVHGRSPPPSRAG